MKHTYCMLQLTAPGWNAAEMIYNCARIGYQKVSFRSIPMGLPGEMWYNLEDPITHDSVEQAIKETGVTIANVDLIAISEDTNVSTKEAAVAAAAELGCESITTNVWTTDKALYTRKVAQVCALAAKYGMTAAFEFVTWSGCRNLATAKELLKTIDMDNARLIVDTLHFYRSSERLSDLDDCPARWFDMVHVCDIKGGIPTDDEELARQARQERLAPGEGEIDIKGIVSYIQQHKAPNAVIGLEIPNTQRIASWGNYMHASYCLAKTVEYLEGNQQIPVSDIIKG